jgi:diguanylate cyclase (GGDEF)-like protein/PAS domain S-box-containing protein
VEVFLVALALFAAGTLFHLTSRTAEVEQTSLAVAQASSDLSSRLTQAYLRLQEALTGKRHVDVDQEVFRRLDGALGLCEAMRDGGQTPLGRIPAATGDARANGERLCRRVAAFRELTEEHWRTGTTSATGQSVEETHAAFRDILWDLDQHSILGRREAAANRRLQQRTNLGTLAGLMLLFGCVVAMVRYHRRLLELKNVGLASLASIVEGSGDAIIGTTPDGRIESWNSAAEHLFGSTASDVMGQPVDLVVQGEAAGRIGAMLDAARSRGRVEHDDGLDCVTNAGRVVPASLTVSPIRDDAGTVVALSLIARDTSEGRALEEQLQHRANHDELTGLGNRALFAERVAHALLRGARERRQVAVIFLDLDGFKAVNDSQGHPAGDELLVEVAARLRHCTRPEDSVARLGGDEFGILVEGTEVLHDALGVADRVLATLATPVTVRGRDIIVGASAGVAVAASGDTGPDELLRDADLAMYRAKAEGKGCYRVFERSMHTALVDRLELEEDLRSALERGELEVHYQPVVASSGVLAGFEALARWRHPRRGYVPPAEFVRVAEEMGLIVPLGEWVLEQACHQAAQWNARYPGDRPLAMSVNLSLHQLECEEITATVARVLAESRFRAGSLVLEITETALGGDPDRMVLRLEELKRLGIRLAVDDFGTGFSSLSRLAQYPVDILKIDRSLTAQITDPAAGTPVVAGTIALAHGMGLRVVSEGVEDAGQVDYLLSQGCDWLQGFYFGRPVSAPETEELLWSARRHCA